MREYDKIRLERKEGSCIKILEAAILCFGKNGYAKASIKEIAELAGVSHGLVGKYYRSKEVLLSEAYIYATKKVYYLTDNTIRERVEFLLRQSVEIANENPPYYDFFKMLITTKDLPEAYKRARMELFPNSPIYTSIENWKKQRNLPDIDAYDMFWQLLKTMYAIIDLYKALELLNDNAKMNTHVLLTYIVESIEKDIKEVQKSDEENNI